MSNILQPPFTGDYSRDIFNERKRYAGILWQQGKKPTDADMNDFVQERLITLQRMVYDAFPSQAVGEAWKIEEAPNLANRSNNFRISTRTRNGDFAQAVYPDSYARLFVGGLAASLTDSDTTYIGLEGRDFNVSVGGDLVFGEIHHRNTGLTAQELTDENVLFVPNELVGMTIVPNVENPAITFTITANTTKTITIGSGNMTTSAAIGDFYYVKPNTPSGTATWVRNDLIWLDVMIGEMSAAEDTALLHPLGNGYESARRFIARQQLQIRQGTVSDPGSPVAAPGLPNITDPNAVDGYYSDGNQIHYCVKLAIITRIVGTADIDDAQITDLRDSHFGSSREVVDARRTYDTLEESIAAADIGLSDRYMGVPAQSNVLGLSLTNVVPIVGAKTYVGETTGVGGARETLKLYDEDGDNPLRADPSSVVSELTAYNITLNLTLDFVVNGIGTPGSPIQIQLAANTDVVAIVSDVNTKLAATALNGEISAYVMQGKFFALRSTQAGHLGFIQILSSSSALNELFSNDQIVNQFPDGSGGLYVDGEREPRIYDIRDGLLYDTSASIVSNPSPSPPNDTPKFYDNPFFIVDAIINASVVARYGSGVLFTDTPGNAYIRRGNWDGKTALDKRLDVEHYFDGVHQDAFLKDSMVDWGTGADQVSAADVPFLTTVEAFWDAEGLPTTSEVATALNILAAKKLSLSGGDMTGAINMQGSRVRNLPTPGSGSVYDNDAVPKAYVDAAASDLHVLVGGGVVAASTTNVVLSSLDAGDTLDNVVLSADDRVLLKDQTNKVENGVWVIQTGVPPVRPSDFDSSTTDSTGAYVFCTGVPTSTNQNTGWVLSTPGNPVPDTDANEWVQFSAAQAYVARDGLDLTGNTFDIDPAIPLAITGGAGTGGALKLNIGTLRPVFLNGVNLDLRITTGLSVDGATGNLRLSTQAEGIGGGIGNKLYVDLAVTNPGLDWEGSGDTRKLRVAAAGAGIAGGGGAKLAVDISATNPGIEFDGGGDTGKLRLDSSIWGNGLAGGGGSLVNVDLATNPGLEFATGKLRIKASTHLALSAAGVSVVETGFTHDHDGATGGGTVGLGDTDESLWDRGVGAGGRDDAHGPLGRLDTALTKLHTEVTATEHGFMSPNDKVEHDALAGTSAVDTMHKHNEQLSLIFNDTIGHKHTGSSNDGTPLPTAGLEDRAVTRIKAHDGMNLLMNCSGELGGIPAGTTSYPYWYLDTTDSANPLWSAFNNTSLKRGPYFWHNDTLEDGNYVNDVSKAYEWNNSGGVMTLSLAAEGISVGTGCEVELYILSYTDAAGTTGQATVCGLSWVATGGTFVKKAVSGVAPSTSVRSYRILRRLTGNNPTPASVTGYIRNIMVGGGGNAEFPDRPHIFQFPPLPIGDVDNVSLLRNNGIISRSRVACVYTGANNADNPLSSTGSFLEPFRCDSGGAGFDFTGTNATVTVGAAWKFTAHRPMVVHISAHALTGSFDVAVGDNLQMVLYKNGGFWRTLGIFRVDNDYAAASLEVNGDTLLNMDTNDYFSIAFNYDVDETTYIRGDTHSWIAVHEIP